MDDAMKDDYPIESFSLTNGIGPHLDDVPMLLRRFADALEKAGPVCVCRRGVLMPSRPS